MSSWSPDELERIGRATELRLASKRPDGSLGPYVTIWVVRAGDDVFVRSAYAPSSGWYRRAAASRHGRVPVRRRRTRRDLRGGRATND